MHALSYPYRSTHTLPNRLGTVGKYVCICTIESENWKKAIKVRTIRPTKGKSR